MSLLDSYFSKPEGVSNVPEVFLFEIVKPEYFLVQVTQSRPFKQVIKTCYVRYALETVPCLYRDAHGLLVLATGGASLLPGGISSYACVTRTGASDCGSFRTASPGRCCYPH